MEEKLTEKYDIKQYAVKLGKEGSGFLYAPKKSEYVYIFTVHHVIVGLENEMPKIYYKNKEVDCKNEKIECCVLDESLQSKDFEDDQYEARKEDVAVLKISKNCFEEDIIFPQEILCLQESMIESNLKFNGFGYPNGQDIPLKLSGTFQAWNKDKKLFSCQADSIKHPDFQEAMEGYSGTGLVMDIQGQLVLVGLVVSCKYGEKHQIFHAVGISEIRNKIEEKGWEVPQTHFLNTVPETFLDSKIIDLENEYIKNAISEIKTEIFNKFYQISQEFIPIKMCECENFFEIPECNNKHRKNCNYYWAGRLLSLLLLLYMNGTTTQKKVMLENGKEVEIEFICSEGNGKADLGTVVESAINENILGKQIKGNCILLWQSKQSPLKRRFKRKNFRNIVGDIASSSLSKNKNFNGYHLLNGEMQQKDFGIVHIHELLEYLSECGSVNKIEETIREVLNGIWE